MKINREFWRRVRKEMAEVLSEDFLCHCSETFKTIWRSERRGIILTVFREWLEKKYQIGPNIPITDSEEVLFDTYTLFDIIGWHERHALEAGYAKKVWVPEPRRMILDRFVIDMCR